LKPEWLLAANQPGFKFSDSMFFVSCPNDALKNDPYAAMLPETIVESTLST